jgi:small conductance mechanosensitive channel
MLGQIFGEPSLRQILLAIFVFVIFLGLAWVFHVFLMRAAWRLAQKTRTRLDDVIIASLGKLASVIIILLGLYLSLLFLHPETLLRTYGVMVLSILLSLLGIYAVVSLINAVIRWYKQDIRDKKKEVGLITGLLSLFTVAVPLFALFLAVLATVKIIGIEAAAVTAWLGEHGWRIIFIILVALMVIIALGELTPRLVVRSLSRRTGELDEEVSKRGNTLSRVLTSAGQIFVIFVAIFTILSELKINIAPILASAGVVGIAIGFGAQSLIKDLIAGLFIVLENQYRVGDVVKISDVAGLVEDVNLRRTVLRDLDGIVHIVPNGEIRVASNYTKDWSRVNLNISVAYGEDLDRVIPIINRVGKELAADPEWAPLILNAPQVLRVDNLGDSGIDIKILGETKPIRQWDVTGELRKRLKKAFDAEGIEIPWPHTKVYFGNAPPYPEGDRGSAGPGHHQPG